ncbi:MAG TPA: DUF1707 domain-containing protein [Gemmatimonadaceae bacterium]|jgi:hypothetical protein|nr:DUF1707 domain-containing protein [Gemmatimonadaceae bacterium]
MAESLPPPSLSRAREQKIDELSRHFANDDLSLEDLERRIERVYKAGTLAELETITADLSLTPLAAAGPGVSRGDPIARVARDAQNVGNQSFGIELPQQRMLAVMSSTRRVGRWAVPRELHVFAMMSDTRLDLTTAMLPIGGVVTIDVTAVMASFRIIASPDMHVINDMHSIMSDVRNSADELPPGSMASARTPVIRVTGTAFMSEVKIKIRRREEPYGDDV